MPSTSNSYMKYGDRAALLALIPGLAHLRNRQYLIGSLTPVGMGVMLRWVCWLGILQFGSNDSSLSTARVPFLLWTLAMGSITFPRILFDNQKKTARRDSARSRSCSANQCVRARATVRD